MRIITWLLALVVIQAASAVVADVEVSEQRLKAHVEFLSSDLLAGRGTGTDGYKISAAYVASQLQAMGIEPAGVDGSYYQQVPLIEASRAENSVEAAITVNGKKTELRFPEQFISSPDAVRGESTVTAETVFVGYGIVAEDRDHNDYAGVDVEGKIVVRLPGRPESWPTEEGAHLSSGREKSRHAVERGAVGMISLHTPKEESRYVYETNYQYLNFPRMRWQGADGRVDGYFPELKGGAYLNMDAAKLLFAGYESELDAIYEADMNNEPLPSSELAATVTLTARSAHRTLSSPNVVGVLRGTDPELRDEYLVLTAHLDGLGTIVNSEGVAEIYPGAMDNATGIASLLETARVLSESPDQLKRSIIFLAVTAEEKGLLGAGYYASYPTVPIDKVVANINLDMPFLGFPFADVVAFGAEHSTLDEIVAAAAEREGIVLAPDPMPEEGIFVRSDHYRFVQEGVPSVMLATGFTSKKPGEDGGELFLNWLKDRYHKPADDLSQPIDYQAAKIFTEINANIGRIIATEEQRPAWKSGSFFGDLFGRDRD